MPDIPQTTEEEQELQSELAKLHSYPKLALWLKLFLDKTNKETYGNRTQSAIHAYNLDPITQYYSAGVIGHENFKKLKTLSTLYYEREGMTAGKVLDLIAMHAVNKGGKALEMLAIITGTYEPKALVAIQNNTQINNVTIDDAKKQKEFKQDFEQFINQKYGKNDENNEKTQENMQNMSKNDENITILPEINENNAISTENLVSLAES